MSILKTFDVDCDFDGCLEWTWGDVGHRVSAKKARLIAKESGWSHRNGNDYCGEHRNINVPLGVSDDE